MTDEAPKAPWERGYRVTPSANPVAREVQRAQGLIPGPTRAERRGRTRANPDGDQLVPRAEVKARRAKAKAKRQAGRRRKA